MDIKVGLGAYVNPYERYIDSNVPDIGDKLSDSGNTEIQDNDVLGIGFLPPDSDGVCYGMKCRHADDSTSDNPIIRVEVSRGNGRVDAYNININKIDTRNATEIEMFALCNYADSIGAGTGSTFGSWQTFKYYSINAEQNGYFHKDNTYKEFATGRYDWNVIVQRTMQDYIGAGLNKQALDGKKLLSIFKEGIEAGKEKALSSFLNDRVKAEPKAPYSHLADENGVITYKGVTFTCNNDKRTLCLGDTSNLDNCLTIPLSGGGCLIVNRNSIGSLGEAIGMFSPEDMGIIMRAIAQDNQCKGKLMEIDEVENGDFHSSENYRKTWEANFKGSAEGVEDAWKNAMEETGIDGFGFDREGKLTHIPQILVARLTMDTNQSVFGNTVESALGFAQKALSELNNRPDNGKGNKEADSAREDEKRFYEAFIEKLKDLI